MDQEYDVIVIGAGHNGLTATARLARAGLKVLTLERADVLGGAARTERPFARAPNLATSTGAYLLGLMPPEIMGELELDVPVIRRDPHYFLPTTGEAYLLFGSDTEAMKRQFLTFFSPRDWQAYRALQRELDQLREDLATCWLHAPLSLSETAERWVRPELRRVFVDLVAGSVGDYLERFGFESELLQAMYAVTDGFSGSSGGWDTPGTGHNFLVHNMCRLPGADGTWMFVAGGMGTVSAALADCARQAGADLRSSSPVEGLWREGERVCGVELAHRSVRARAVVAATDPWTMRTLAGGLGDAFDRKLDALERPGTTLKLNMALKALPTFTCLPQAVGQHYTTIHLLPQDQPIADIRRAHAQAMAGDLPEEPTIEWYIHPAHDGALRDEHGHLSSALFVQWVPHQPAGSTWDEAIDDYADHLLGICERYAPGTRDLVADTFALHPDAIASHFGIHNGHIHHVDNLFAFDDRVPYRAPVDGLYACGAGCHPAGSVIGAAGYNAAAAVLEDLDLR